MHYSLIGKMRQPFEDSDLSYTVEVPLGKFDCIFMAVLHLKITVKHSIIYTFINKPNIHNV
jgi:hypothetical protein